MNALAAHLPHGAVRAGRANVGIHLAPDHIADLERCRQPPGTNRLLGGKRLDRLGIKPLSRVGYFGGRDRLPAIGGDGGPPAF